MNNAKYGITQAELKQARSALQDNYAGHRFGYLMQQLAQTYRVRKVMHGLR